MSTIDIEALTAEVSPEAPCGEDLEYDPAFAEMERAAEGKPEQEIGDTKVAAEDPDWKALKSASLAVMGRTRDLRATVFLVRALMQTDGIPGYADGLVLLRDLLAKYWEPIHPLLDPDDGNDPTMRINIIVSLVDGDAGVNSLKTAPLVSSKALGIFGLRDIEIALGEVPAPPPVEGEPPHAEMTTIEAAFMDAELEELQATAAALDVAAEAMTGIDTFLTETVGAAQSPDLSGIHPVFEKLKQVMNDQLVRRGVGVEVEEGEGGEGGEAGKAKGLSGEVQSREDVVRALDKIVDYFNRNEPSSPIPLLMTRAKRLISKNFIEIVRDLAPSGVTEAEAIRGVEESSDGW